MVILAFLFLPLILVVPCFSDFHEVSSVLVCVLCSSYLSIVRGTMLFALWRVIRAWFLSHTY